MRNANLSEKSVEALENLFKTDTGLQSEFGGDMKSFIAFKRAAAQGRIGCIRGGKIIRQSAGAAEQSSSGLTTFSAGGTVAVAEVKPANVQVAAGNDAEPTDGAPNPTNRKSFYSRAAHAYREA